MVRVAPTKADEIVLVLEQAILAGELAPGEVLRQEQLSDDFGVSRTPIREALRELAALGLVSLLPKRGARVRFLSTEDLHQTFLVRAALEGFAAELARERLTKQDLRKLTAAAKRFAELTQELRTADLGDIQTKLLAADWVHANEAFHDVILQAADAPRLAEAARGERRVFHGQAVWASSSAELDQLYTRNLDQHAAILDAARARSPELRSLVETHILDSGTLLERAFQQAGYGRRTFLSQRVSWRDEGGEGTPTADAVEAS
jgi:DNA-binding GntR family transcriptional regulator